MPGGYRYRNMFYATGLPGWMRFGYSPGWGGLPPGAQYLMQSGQMPQFWSWMRSQAPYMSPWPMPMMPQSMPYSPNPMTPPMGMPGMSSEQEAQMLESQARMLEQELEQIRERIKELGKEE